MLLAEVQRPTLQEFLSQCWKQATRRGRKSKRGPSSQVRLLERLHQDGTGASPSHRSTRPLHPMALRTDSLGRPWPTKPTMTTAQGASFATGRPHLVMANVLLHANSGALESGAAGETSVHVRSYRTGEKTPRNGRGMTFVLRWVSAIFRRAGPQFSILFKAHMCQLLFFYSKKWRISYHIQTNCYPRVMALQLQKMDPFKGDSDLDQRDHIIIFIFKNSNMVSLVSLVQI